MPSADAQTTRRRYLSRLSFPHRLGSKFPGSELRNRHPTNTVCISERTSSLATWLTRSRVSRSLPPSLLFWLGLHPFFVCLLSQQPATQMMPSLRLHITSREATAR